MRRARKTRVTTSWSKTKKRQSIRKKCIEAPTTLQKNEQLTGKKCELVVFRVNEWYRVVSLNTQSIY